MRLCTNIPSILYGCALLLAAACTPSEQQQPKGSAIDSLPVLRTVGLFSGIDQNGNEFSSESLKGTVWIGSFFFTSCSSICPALNRVQMDLQREFAKSVRFVSISSDPETDTPPVLKEYAAEYGARNGVWWMLAMPHQSMLSVASTDLGLIAPTEPDVHSTRFVLVDTAMRVRGYYDSADTAQVALLRAILREVR